MLLGFKTELKLNDRQRTRLAKHCGVARHAWNWGLWLTKNILNHNQANPQEKLKFPTAIDLHKLLVSLVKSQNPWYYECSKSTPQIALIALPEAWKRCFKKTAGLPRFKMFCNVESISMGLDFKIDFLNSCNIPGNRGFRRCCGLLD
ncbi:MAG: helix-turn-helix domain-containing protein [Microcoleus sp.]